MMTSQDWAPLVQALIGLAAGAITVLSGFALNFLRILTGAWLENLRVNRALSAAHNGVSLALQEAERLGFGGDIETAETWLVERAVAYMRGGKAGEAVTALGYTPERLGEMAKAALGEMRRNAVAQPALR